MYGYDSYLAREVDRHTRQPAWASEVVRATVTQEWPWCEEGVEETCEVQVVPGEGVAVVTRPTGEAVEVDADVLPWSVEERARRQWNEDRCP